MNYKTLVSRISLLQVQASYLDIIVVPKSIPVTMAL